MSSPDNPLEIPEFRPGERFSIARINTAFRRINAMIRATVTRGSTDSFCWSDQNVILQLAQAGGEGTTGSGNVTYRGEYSATVNYAQNDLVYTAPDSNTRIPWICLTANGPATAVSTPTFPEPPAAAWKCLAKASGGAAAASYYRIKSVERDSLTCVAWNPTTETEGATVHIAKPPKIREGIPTETPGGGIIWTYAIGDTDLPNNRVRTKTETRTIAGVPTVTAVEYEQVIPMWCVDDVILAYPTAGTGVRITVEGVLTELTLQMVPDGRAWAVNYDQ